MKEKDSQISETGFCIEENCFPEDMDYIIQSIEKNIEAVSYSENKVDE